MMTKKAGLLLLIGTLLFALMPAMQSPVQAETRFACNGGFEDGLSGWTQVYGSDSISASIAQKYSGDYSLEINDSTSAEYGVESCRTPAAPGVTYTASAEVYVESGTIARIYLKFWNDAGQEVGNNFTNAPAPATSWQGISVSMAAPAGTTSMSILLYSPASTMTKVYFDEVYINDPNLVCNGGLESGNLSEWTQTYGKGGITASQEKAFTGAYSVKINDTQTGAGTTENPTDYGIQSCKLSATQGVTYTASAKVYVESGTLGRIYLKFWNDAGQLLTDTQFANAPAASNSWKYISVSMAAPAGTASVSVLLYSTTTGATTIYFDDVTIEDNHMACNGGFESGDLANWTQTIGTGSITASTEQAYSGAYSVKIADANTDSMNGAYGLQSCKIPATPGVTYTASAKVYVSSGTLGRIYLKFWDDAGQLIADTLFTNAPSASSSWEDISVSMAAPAGAASVGVLLYSATTTTTTVYFDNVYIQENQDVCNGGFESGSLAPWAQNYGTDSVTISTAKAYTGTNSLLINDTSTGTTSVPGQDYGFQSCKVPVTPGTTYTASAKVYVASGSLGRIYLKFWDAAGQAVGTQFRNAPPALSAWQDLRVSMAAPAGAVTASVLLYSSTNNATTIYFDDVAITDRPLTYSPENSGFENELTGWWRTNPQVAIATSGLEKYTGKYSLHLSNAADASGAQSNRVIATPGASYTAHAKVRIVTGNAQLYLKFYDASNNELDSANNHVGIYATNSKFEDISIARVAPAGTETYSVVVYSAATPHDLYFDDVEVNYKISGKVTDFFTHLVMPSVPLQLFKDTDTAFSNPLQSAVSDSLGNYAFTAHVPSGRYLVRAAKSGYATTNEPAIVIDQHLSKENVQMPSEVHYTTATLPKPISGHPRLYVQASDIEGLYAKTTSSLLQPAWNKVLKNLEIMGYTAKSSGNTASLQTFTLPTVQSARYVRIVGKGNDRSVFNSITEAKVQEKLTNGSVVDVALTGTNVSSSSTCGPTSPPQFPASNAIDNDLNTYWCGQGIGEWIQFDLGAVKNIPSVKLAWYGGEAHVNYFDIDVSSNGTSWTRIDLGLGLPMGEVEPMQTGATMNYNAGTLQGIESAALIYLIKGTWTTGKHPVDMMKNYLDTVEFVGASNYHQTGNVIRIAAEVYDWCYPLISAEDRTDMISKIKALAGHLEFGYPPVHQSMTTSHGSGDQLLKNLIAAGVAVYDEDPEIYNTTAIRIFNEAAPYRNFFYEADMNTQGDSYGMDAIGSDMWSQIIYRRMGMPDLFTSKLPASTYREIYTRRPDGQLLRDGDSWQAIYNDGIPWTRPQAELLAATLSNDPYVKDAFYEQYVPGTIDPVMEILFVDKDLGSSTADISSLPLTRYFGAPMGTMVARTGWDDPSVVNKSSSSVVAEMKIGGYFFEAHQHQDMGSFQVYYKGALALSNSGMYGDGTYGSEHHMNYYQRSVASNTMLVYDPNEPEISREFLGGSITVPRSGGQRATLTWDEPLSLDDLVGKDRKYADVTGHAFGPNATNPDYSYIKGDLTGAYTDKVTQFNRSMVFLNLKDSTHPAAMVVFDKVVSKDPSFKKTWLLHSMEQPVVSGTTTTITNSADGYSGRLINDTLLPTNPSINLVGGANHEFDVNGTNYPQANPNPGFNDIEAGAWRVELSPDPNAPAKSDLFLNVMQFLDNDSTTKLQVVKLDGTEMVGAKISDRAVLFSKSGDRLRDPVTITVSGSEASLQFVVTDLAAGTWNIERDGVAAGTGSVTEDGNVLTFSGAPGTYVFTRQS